MRHKKMFYLIILLGLMIPTLALASVSVYVDQEKITFPDQQPLINADNRTLVPLRFVTKALKGKVVWLAPTQTVEIEHSVGTISLTVGENFAYKNGEKIPLDTTAIIKGDRTMVPLRFISECFGAHVYWNSSKRKVFITTQLPPVNEFKGIPFKPEDLPLVDGGTQIILIDSDKPSARIQYVEVEDLPIKLKEGRSIYSLNVDENFVYVKQSSDLRLPIPLYMVENGYLNRNRRYTSDLQESTIFTYKYPVQSRLEQAMGEDPVDLKKVKGFALYTLTDEGFRMLIIANPLYQGEN